MAKIERFEDLQAWQKARQLANAIYDLASTQVRERFPIANQIREPQDQSCTTSRKGLIRVPILNLFAF